MTKTLLSGMILTAGIGLLSISQESRAYEILAPGNLGAEVNGMIGRWRDKDYERGF